jgi:butyryl-CoA dehydrogenase
MWISGAGNDLVENIVHLVLARIDGAPSGPAGISLFIIPRFRADDQGLPTVSNDVTVAGLNKKMGFHGVPNTVLNFGEKDDCHAFLVGEANKGLGYMFHLINEARLWVGMGATMLASTGFRQAL